MIDIVADGGLLALGREGENEAVRIVLLNSWPDAGAVLVLHQRATDKLPHPVTTTEENGNIYWVVGAADTEAPGFGRAEVRWLDDAGRIVKSRVYQTYVDKSIASPSAAPDSWETYVNQVAKDAAAAKEAAKAAAAAAESTGGNASAAAEAKEAAESAANLAETAKNNALNYKDYAERACKDAQSAKDGAVSAAGQADAASTQAAASASTAASSAERAEEAANKAEDALAAVPGAVQTAAGPLVSQAAASASAASASATAAAASAESVKASAEQITANKEAIETITPDDAVIDGKPWTSKKIVDVLYPPIEETGNPVQCYPVTGYPLDVTASWEPVQEGSGDPSPENIRPIKGRDSVTVERCGENLCNPKKVKHDTFDPYGLTIQYVEDNKVHLQGTYSGADNASFVIMDTNQSLLAGRGLKIYGLVVDGKAKPFSLYGLRTANETVIAMQVIDWKPGDAVEMTIAIVVTNSTTAPTTYAPYIGQTNALTLPETVYGGEVDAVSGEGQETWKTITLDATEDWAIANAGETKQFFYTTKYDFCKIPIKVICSHFHNVVFVGTAIIRIYTSIFTDADAFKSYLAAQYAAGTPVQVCYKLAEPAPFTATGAQPLPALAGLNTVLTDADTLTVRARENRPQTWQEIEAFGNQIDALTTRLKSGKLADAELHLGFYIDSDGDLCQKED